MDITEAARRLGKSNIVIRRAIKSGKLDAKMIEGKYEITEEALGEYASITRKSTMIIRENEELERLRDENEKLKQEITRLSDLVNEKDKRIEDRQKIYDEMVMQFNQQTEESRQRSDTIILQLTRQLEQSQQLIEYHQEPWYRKLFRRKQEAAETEGK